MASQPAVRSLDAEDSLLGQGLHLVVPAVETQSDDEAKRRDFAVKELQAALHFLGLSELVHITLRPHVPVPLTQREIIMLGWQIKDLTAIDHPTNPNSGRTIAQINALLESACPGVEIKATMPVREQLARALREN